MKASEDKIQESQNSTIQIVSQESSNGGTAQLMDNRSSAIVQRKLQESMSASCENDCNPTQRKTNTGLPDNLKSGIENLSGYSMDDVKVHYNSSKPAQLQAHAYAQGTDIHLASGQEKHLPHEAWHVVQQKQGRVKPTRQLKSKVNINDDSGLEREADVMGVKALQRQPKNHLGELNKQNKSSIVQRVEDVDPDCYRYILKLIFAGSGHDYINVDEEEKYQEKEGFNKVLGIQMQEVSKSIEDGVKVDRVNIAGPGSPSAPGLGNGNFDTGSNKISRLKTKGLEYAISKLKAYIQPGIRVEVEIVGHSRGAVAGAYVAESLRKEYPPGSGIYNISYIGYDPVPGPLNIAPTKKTDLSKVKSTVVYSVASGSGALMAPKELNAKVVILTSAQHSANQRGGFVYLRNRYTSSGISEENGIETKKLSELRPGVYAEKLNGNHNMVTGNKPSDAYAFGDIEIEYLQGDTETIMKRYDELRKKKEVLSDFGRKKQVKKAVKQTAQG